MISSLASELKGIDHFIGSYLLSASQPRRLNFSSPVQNPAGGKFTITHSGDSEGGGLQTLLREGVFLLLKGEIYNLDRLTKRASVPGSRTNETGEMELLHALYRKEGIDFLKHVDGRFSIVLLDDNKDTLMVAVDRYGLAQPVYYHIGKRLTFSSHLKLILCGEGVPHDIDTDALALFLKYSYIPSPMSIIKGIRKMSPGEVITCYSDTCKITRYIDFQRETRDIDMDEAIGAYRNLLGNSMRRRTRHSANAHAGIFLSGGLDSSANVALATEVTGCSFEAFGIGFEDPDIDERPFARAVADHFGIKFNDYTFTGEEVEDMPDIIWHMEEPFMENGLFLTYAGFKSAHSKVQSILTGNCTDQLFGTGGFTGGLPIALRYLSEKGNLGCLIKYVCRQTNRDMFYEDNVLFKVKKMLERVCDLNDWFFWGFDNFQLKELCRFEISQYAIKPFSDDLRSIPLNLNDYYNFSIIHQDIEHYACQNVLVKTHRMAEMFSIAARDPYLDYELVDFVLSLPVSLKRQGSLRDYLFRKTKAKYLHRQAFEGLLPQSVMSKPKQGGLIFMNLLLKNNTRRESISRYLMRSELINDYMNMSYIKELLSSYGSTKNVYWQNYHDTQANKILYLLNFALWGEIILSGNRRKPHTRLEEMLS